MLSARRDGRSVERPRDFFLFFNTYFILFFFLPPKCFFFFFFVLKATVRLRAGEIVGDRTSVQVSDLFDFIHYFGLHRSSDGLRVQLFLFVLLSFFFNRFCEHVNVSDECVIDTSYKSIRH